MKINPSYRPELCICPDPVRSSISSAHLEGGTEPRLIATNGHALVSFRVDMDESDHAGPVSADALKAARKAAGRRPESIKLGANGCYTMADGSTMPRPTTDAKFPPWREVVPAYKRGTDGTMSVCLNAELLAELARAMGTNGQVTLTFPAHDAGEYMGAPIRVEDPRNDETVAVIMPCNPDIAGKKKRK